MVVDAACKKKCDSFQLLLDNLMIMLHQHVSCYMFAVVIVKKSDLFRLAYQLS